MNEEGHAPSRCLLDVATTRLDRRVILKAVAAFGAMSVVGGATQAQRANAQDGATNSTTREGTWVEADHLGDIQAADTGSFVSNFPFYAIGAHWDGSVGTWPVIELSVSVDGVTYSEPFYLSASTEDAGQPERDGRLFTPLLFTEGASFVQYRTLDIDGVPGEVTGLAFTYIDATDGPWEGDVARVSIATTDPSTPPAIISREEWGADESYRYASYGEIWPPEYATVEKVIIHHTETPNTQDPVVAMRSIYYYHAVTRGWGDIGYNYLVDRFGNIYEGRAGGQNVIGGHAYQFAIGSSGIGTIGNFALQDVSAEAQAGIVAITAWVGRDLDPLGSSDFHEAPDLPTICAHRDVNQSTCPGDLLYDDLPTIRQYVAQVLNGDPTGPPGGLVIGDTVKVDADSLSLRSAPTTTAGLIATLPYGTTGVVVDGPQSGEGFNWYQIETSLGTGWASADFLVLAPPAPPPGGDFGFGDNVVTTQSVNLRSTPSTSAGVVTILASGTRASILDGPRAANGYDWYQVRTASGTAGWLVSAYLRLADANTTPTNPKFAVGDFVTTNSSGVALRARPGLANAIIATMPLGTQLEITGEPTVANGYVWYGVYVTGYGGGWTVEDYLTLVTAPPPPTGGIAVGDTVAVDTDALNIRSGAGTSASVIAVLSYGTQGTVIGGPQTASGYTWWQLRTAQGTGWCAGSFLREVSGGNQPPPPPPPDGIAVGDTVSIDTDALNMRSGPGTSASVIAVLSRGSQGKVVGGPQSANGYTWWQIQTSQGTGWCAGSFLREVTGGTQPPPPTTGIAIGDTVVTTDDLNMRSRAGTSASIITVLPASTQGTVIGGPQSTSGYTWWQLQTSRGTGWCAGSYLAEV